MKDLRDRFSYHIVKDHGDTFIYQGRCVSHVRNQSYGGWLYRLVMKRKCVSSHQCKLCTPGVGSVYVVRAGRRFASEGSWKVSYCHVRVSDHRTEYRSTTSLAPSWLTGYSRLVYNHQAEMSQAGRRATLIPLWHLLEACRLI